MLIPVRNVGDIQFPWYPEEVFSVVSPVRDLTFLILERFQAAVYLSLELEWCRTNSGASNLGSVSGSFQERLKVSRGAH